MHKEVSLMHLGTGLNDPSIGPLLEQTAQSPAGSTVAWIF